MFDRTALRHLQPGTGVGVIERERLAVAHDLLAADEKVPGFDWAGRGAAEIMPPTFRSK